MCILNFQKNVNRLGSFTSQHRSAQSSEKYTLSFEHASHLETF